MFTEYHAKTISFEIPSQNTPFGKIMSNYFNTFLDNLPANKKYLYLFIKLIILSYL